MKTILHSACLALGMLAALPASPAYPDKPVRLIVPYAAGGPTDAVARTVGQALSKSIGQPVVVENQPGADGAIAARAVIAAAADGYTYLFSTASLLTLPMLSKSANFDPQRDLAPVAAIGKFPFAMFVSPSVPASNVAEFIAYARANPDKLNFAASTPVEYLAASEFMKATGVRMVRVPYKGIAQAVPDLIAGRVQVTFGPLPGGLAYVKDGRLRALAVLTPQRAASLPDVPTMAEAGVPGISLPTWQAILAPSKTPKAFVDRISRDVNLLLQSEDVRSQLERQILHVEGGTALELASTIRSDTESWKRFTRENGIVPN